MKSQQKQTTVLLTGATSFSGCYIAQTLIQNHYSLICPLQSERNKYSGLKDERLKFFEEQTEIISPIDIGSLEFLDLVNKKKPEVFMNHGGYIQNYRSPDFDFLKHLETNLKHIKVLIETLKTNGCKLFVHTGSAFEPGEEYSKFGVSPYGVAKKMVWDMTLYWCKHFDLPVVKVVIPNPYGHLENDDRLLPVFAKLLAENKDLKLSGANDIRNNIRGEELAKYFLQAVKLAEQDLPADFVFIVKPIGYIETQKNFVLRSLQEHPYNFSLEQIEKHLKII